MTVPLVGPGSRLPLDQTVTAPGDDDIALRGLIGAEGLFLAVIKTECPTCELLAPFLDRIAQHHGATGLPVVVVSQNTREELTAYCERLGLLGPVQLDAAPYALSAALGLRVVPTCLRIDESGVLIRIQEGFSRAFLDDLDGELSSIAGQTPAGVFDEQPAPELRPG